MLGPNIPAVVDFLMIGETALAVVFAASFVLSRRHLGRYHHFATIGAFLADMVLFKPLMLLRAADGSNGFLPWGGTNVMPHLIAAVIVAALGVVAIYIGLRKVIRKEKKMFMPPKGKRHRLIGYAFLVAWYATYAIGIIIYLANWG